MNRFLLFITIIGVLVLSACDPSNIYEKHLQTNNLQWHTDDIKSFTVNIDDTALYYDLHTAVRYIDNCPYPEITVKMTVNYNNNSVIEKEGVVNIKDKDGEYIGDVSGNMWDCDNIIIDNYKFNHTGEYIVTIQAVNPEKVYSLIQDVGLIVKKVEK